MGRKQLVGARLGANQAVNALAVSGSDLYAGAISAAGGKNPTCHARTNLLTLPLFHRLPCFLRANVILKWRPMPSDALQSTHLNPSGLDQNSPRHRRQRAEHHRNLIFGPKFFA
jgi:hypothetical protein